MQRKVLLVHLGIYSLQCALGLPELSCTVRLTELNIGMIASACFLSSALNQYRIDKIKRKKKNVCSVLMLREQTNSCRNKRGQKLNFWSSKLTQSSVEALRKKSLSQCKIFMIRHKLLSFVSATAQEKDVKEIHSHVRLQIHKKYP